MQKNLLILGGTTEATALCNALAKENIPARLSLAGRVERPRAQPLPIRIGGFGGADGLAAYIQAENITHVIDATHPFAAQMSHNAIAACAQTNSNLIALSRAPWAAQSGDKWTHVPDMARAAQSLVRPSARVMLAVGRMHLNLFEPIDQHFYLLRLVDPPKSPPKFSQYHAEISRGPFTHDDDLALMQRFGINLVVSKNAGGTGAYSKISAARALGIEVIMIDRPAIADRAVAHNVGEVMAWLANHA